MSISKNSSFIFTSQAVVFITGILASIVVTRALGPRNRGIYFLVLTINTLVVNVANMGIRFTNTYILSKGKYNLIEVNSNSILIAILVGAVSLIGYLLFGEFINTKFFKEIKPLYVFLSISLIPFTLYSQYWRGAMAGLNKFFLISVLDILSAIIGVFLSIIVVLTWGLSGVLWLWFITGICLSLLELYFINRIEKVRLRFSWRVFKDILCFGFVGHLGNIACYIYSKIDVFIVNFFSGVTGVGFYSLATTVAENVSFVPNAITTATNPRLGSSKSQDANKLAAKLSRHNLFTSALTALCILIVIPWGIPLLYGHDFLPTIKPLMILLPGMIFMPVSSSLASFFTFHKGKPGIPATVSWISLLVNIPLCIFLTAKFGFPGTAMAVAITHLLQFTILSSLFITTSKVKIGDSFIARPEDIKAYFSLIIENITKIKLFLRHLKLNFGPSE